MHAQYYHLSRGIDLCTENHDETIKYRPPAPPLQGVATFSHGQE